MRVPAYSLMLMSGSVLASTTSATGPSQSTASLETVVVTGSLIPTEAADRTGPLTVLDRDALTRGANDSLGAVLQTLPFNTGSPLNTNNNNGGDGSVRLDLRGIGPQHTLVLLNGRRFPNGGVGGDSSVDLNTLPLSMIDRVEVLTTGASAVYGADAVAGVVNVITRTGYRGVEIEAQRSESAYGDGSITRGQALFGHDFGAGNWMLGLDYVNQQAVLQGARGYSAKPLKILDANGAVGFFGSSNTPDGRFKVPDPNALGLPAGLYTRVPGAIGQAASDYRLYTPSDAFNYAPYNYLQTPSERSSAWLLGSQPLGSLTLFAEGLFDFRTSSQLLAPTPYSIADGLAPELSDGTAGIPANNFYNPFGVDITKTQRRFIENPDRGFRQDISLWRALLGIRGEVASWFWNVSVAEAQSRAKTTENGETPGVRLVQALGPSGPDASGNVVCGVPDPNTGIVAPGNAIAGCVPLDLFHGAGSITAAQLGYITVPLHDQGTNEQSFIDAELHGTLGRLPGGPINWAMGAELRREAGSYRFDPLRSTGTAGSGLATDIPGAAQRTRELYAEARLPLTAASAGAPGAADAVIGARLSDFSSFGTHPSWHAGLHWQTLNSVALRADYSEVFRAPSLSELYTVQVKSQVDIVDPCGNNPNQAQRANCLANGVPGGSYVQQAPVNALFGGNPGLTPESGASLDVGVDFGATESAWRASVDFYRLDFKGFILASYPSDVLDGCATLGAAAYCDTIRRLADGSIDVVDLRNLNVGRALVQGIDLTGAASILTLAGRIRVSLTAAYLEKNDLSLPDGTVFHGAGTYPGAALPRWRGLGRVTLQHGALQLGYALQFIGTYTECGDATGTLDPERCRTVSSVIYHDLDAQYFFGSRLRLGAGVNNLSDRQPPFLNDGAAANTDVATYRLLGRTFFVELAYKID